MSNGRNKVCPRCGEVAALTAERCRGCGRQYRTQFSGASGTPVSRKGPYDNARKSDRGKKAPRASLLPPEFHRPSDEFPEFAAPEGMPPTYHDLPNIEVLRKDLSESLAKIGTPNSQPFSQLYLADAPGSPLAYEPPVIPNLLPFPSSAGPQYGEFDGFDDGSVRGLDWTKPDSMLGQSATATIQEREAPELARIDSAPESERTVQTPEGSIALITGQSTAFLTLDQPRSLVPKRTTANFALNVSPVDGQVDADDGNFLTINDLLPYDKAVKPLNKWIRYSLNAFLIGISISIITSTANYLHLRPTNFLGMAMLALAPVKGGSSSAMPMTSAGDVIVDRDGDFVKKLKVVDHSQIKGLNPSVFSQLSSGNSTVGVISVAPQNVAVLPIDGTPDPDNSSDNQQGDSDSSVIARKMPKAFSQTSFPVVGFKFHHNHPNLRYGSSASLSVAGN